MVLALALAACTGGEESPSGPVSPLDRSWMAEVARDPAAFSAVVDTDRDAWIALQRNDWKTALPSASEAGVRARRGLAGFHGVLAQLETAAVARLDEAWQANGGPPAESDWALLAHASAVQGGDPARIAATEGRLTAGQRSLATSLSSPGPSETHPLLARKRVHDAVLAPGGDVSALVGVLEVPTLAERAGGAERELWDPWAHHTLSAWYLGHPKPITPEGGYIPGDLSDRLFSASVIAGVHANSTLAVLGIPPTPTDDAQACREAVRAFDSQLDAWSTSVAATLSDDGRALLTDLRLVSVARARVLETLAVDSLAAAPNCALAYALLAQDHADSRAINAVNSPTLFAILASAQLATGHTREALDALEPLTAAFPEIHGLDETVGDLAILQGIHRTGDSREN